MPSILKLKKSSVVGKVPLTTDLDYGELAINYADGKLYFKDAVNTINFFKSGEYLPLSGGTLTGALTVNSGGLNVTGVSNLTGAVNVTTGAGVTLPADINHTGTYTYGLRVGDATTATNNTGIYLRTTNIATIAWGAGGKLVFATSGGSVSRFTIGTVGQLGIGASESYGTAGQVLTSGGPSAAPTWTTVSGGGGSGTVTSVSGTGTVSGLTLSGTVTTSGDITLGGTLAVTESNFSSQTTNTFLAAPNGSSGTPTFRKIAAADILKNIFITSASTITPASDTADQYNITALAVDANIAIPSGSPINGQRLTIRIEDAGVAKSLSWVTTSGGYRAIGCILPTVTVATKVVYIGCIYNSTDSFWDVVSVAQQT